MKKGIICASAFVLFFALFADFASADPNIVGHWKFDGASGTTAIDSSGNNYNGTIFGGAALNGSGRLTLDGVDDYVTLPIGPLLATLTNCSFVAWIDFADSGGAWQRIFDFGSSTTVNMFLTPSAGGGGLRFAITTGGSGGEQKITAASALTGGVHRVIVTINADTDTGRLYLDDVLVAQNTSLTLTPSSLGNTTRNWLGRSQYSGDAYFKGSYDEFIIYNYVLPESEILGPSASGPSPADGAQNVVGDVLLSWLAGYGAVSHDVYFGTHFGDVNDANNTLPIGGIYKGSQPVIDCSYDPGRLDEGQTYYWRIDEVNGASITKGDVWSFTIFSYIFEGYEIYGNSSELNTAWVPSGSAAVQLATETSHKGQQSMELSYANESGNYYSKAKKTFSPAMNWQVSGVGAISLYFKGIASNDADQLYLIIEDGDWIPGTAVIKYDGNPNDLKKEYWQRWDIDLQELIENNPTFRIKEISSIAVAVGDISNQQPGGSGTIYIDDIGFKEYDCIEKNKPVADFDGDCDVDSKDMQYLAQRWLDEGTLADLIEDGNVDFKDYSVAADKWLGSYDEWPAALDPDEFLDAVPFYDVNITGGLWAERMETDRTVTIPHLLSKLESERRIDNLRIAAGLMTGSYYGYVFNDSDVYKTIEAIGYSLKLYPDPALEATTDNIIDIIEAAQWEDGYLNSYYTIVKPAQRWTNEESDHETYCAGHFIEGALAYYDATGKQKIMNIATKLADHMNTTFGEGRLMDPPGHQEVELALMKLYNLTGDVNYLNLTKFFIDQRGNAAGHSLYGTYSQDHVPLVQQDTGVGHAVRACYFYHGVVEVAREILEQDYMKATMKVWDNIVSAKTYIIGGLGQPGGPEGFTVDYALGNNSYCETCASIAFANWNHRMFLVTGDGKYLDMMERSIYNNILSGISLSGNRFFYPNALESGGATRPDWYACACCPPNEGRFIMSIGEKSCAHNDDAIYMTMYIEGNAQVQMTSNTVNFAVDTNYPWDGDITITVNPQQSASLPIYLRIPGWARNMPVPGNLYDYISDSPEQVTLQVNSSPVQLDIVKGFAKIERTWNAGDTIHLVLPMPVRKVIAHPLVTADTGKVVIERGPVVYCAEGIDNGGSVSGITIPDSLAFTATYEPSTLRGVVVLRSTSPSVTMVPYYTWANRGSTPMRVWQTRQQ